MLTDSLYGLPVALVHWTFDVLGIGEGMHSWCPGLCPCDAYGDDGDLETPGWGAGGEDRPLPRSGSPR